MKKNTLLIIAIISLFVVSCQNGSKPSSNITVSESLTSSLPTNVENVTSQEVTTSNTTLSSNTNSFITTSVGNQNSLEVEKDYTDYYSRVKKGMKGKELQETLQSIISSPYETIAYKDLKDKAYKDTDCYPNTEIIWDMYSNERYPLNHNGGNAQEGAGWNKEHSVPQSYFNEASPMKSDLFHVYPTDCYVNNMRSNHPYGEVSVPEKTSKNGSKLGSCSFPGYTGKCFEPIDEYKGDFARTYFYFATRYPGKATLTANGRISFTTSYPYLTTYAINLFTKWAKLDPVSQKEIDRNNAVHKIQKNRNPFIDHPEFSDIIFGNSSSSTGGNTSTSSNNIITTSNITSLNKTDEDYANEVIALIEKIGGVTIGSKALIDEARNAYNSLSNSQKELVTNENKLIEAELEYERLIKLSQAEVECEFKGSLPSNKRSIVSSNITWTSNIDMAGIEENRGLQFTNSTISSTNNKTLILETTDYINDINQITLKLATNAEVNKTSVEVHVGENKLLPNDVLISSKELSDYVFTPSSSIRGKISIKVTTELTSKSVYFKKISIK